MRDWVSCTASRFANSLETRKGIVTKIRGDIIMGIKITNMKNFNFPSLLKRSAASLIAYSLTFQLAFSPFARLTATANSPEPSASIFEQAAEIIERKQAYVNSDPFLTRDQTVEIYDRKGNLIETIHFDQLSLKRVRPAITLSKARIEVESGDLLIEGFRGADEAGDGGFLIARHRISNLNLATENIDSSGDHELLMMVTKRGDLRAIDWGYVTLHAFETPILVHTLYNTLKANSQAELQNVRAEFWTPGRKPFSENDLVQDAVVPRDPATGKIFIEGGDLVVRSAEGDPNGSFVVGVYSRRVTHQKIAQDNIIISMMSDILSGNTQIIKDLDQLFRENESQYEKIMTDLNQIQNDSESDPKISFLIQSLPSHAIDTIRNRAKTNKRAGDRVVEKDSLKGWAEVYQNIKEKLTQKNNKSLVPLSDEAIARRWQEAFGPKPVDNNENLGFDFNKWTAVAIGSYMLAGAGLGYVESIEQVKILGWIYTHAFPDVLKDASYRWPLLVSSFYLTMLWPTAVGISMLSGKILDGLNSVTRNSHSKFAQFIRDLSASWGKMSNWTRITTMSLRIYPEFILGFWITAIERLGRQKTFFSAINNNINPFKIIEPSSEIGSKLKLNRPMRAGFINPFLNRDRFNEELKQKDAILSELKIQADKKLSRAWMLAASAVGAKYGIDLGTLLILQGKKDIRIADLEDLIKNPKACQEWEILTDDLYRSEMELFPFSSDEREIEDLIPPEKVAEQFLLIEKMADRIVQLDPKRKLLKKIFSKARTRFWLFKLWLANLGRKEY